MITLEVLRTGPLALVEDLGRPGLAHVGVTRSGAADRWSHRLANRLVANPDDRATVEVTFGGFTARVHGGNVDVAVTGADVDPSVNGIPFGINSIHRIHDGEVLSLGTPHTGLRSYLAVRGGIDVDAVLGSRSYDVMSAIGPRPLQTGDILPVGPNAGGYPELDQAPVSAIAENLIELHVVPGPRDDWFADPDTGLGLGYEGAALVFAAGLVMVTSAYFWTKWSHTMLFWAAFILTRPIGATVGDFSRHAIGQWVTYQSVVLWRR